MVTSASDTLAGKIVSRLGGEEAIAEGLDGEITPKAVEQWWRRGRIPADRDFGLLKLAARTGVSLSHEELSQTRRGRLSSADADTTTPNSSAAIGG
jgi:hypothetical protein